MTPIRLEATPRSATGKGINRRLRASGSVPAVVYGGGRDAVPVAVPPKAMVAILNGEYGRNTVIDLAIEGEDAPRSVIVRDYQVHPVKRTLIHLDFWEITPDTTLRLTVPFVREGRAPAEKMGGKVQQLRYDLVIRCKPADIPPRIAFDMTTMPNDNVNIAVSMVPMPEGVTPVFKHDFNVIRLKMPSATATAAAADAAPAKGGKAPAKGAAKAKA